MIWQIFALSSLLSFIVCVALGIVVYTKNPTNAINARFSITSILIGLWSLFPFTVAVVEDAQKALFFGRIIYIAAVFTPSAFFHFVFVTLGIYERPPVKRAIAVFYWISSFMLLLLPTPYFIRGVVGRAPESLLIPGVLYPLFILFFISLCPYAIYQLYTHYAQAIGYRKEQLKFLFSGFVIALIGGGIHIFSPYVRLELFPHDILLIAWCLIISYAIVRYRLMDIRIVLTRAGAFFFVYTGVLGVPLTIGFVKGRWMDATMIMAVLASAGPFVYVFLKEKAENILLAEQRHYQKILMQASEGMTKEHDLGRLLQLIVRIIKRSVQVSFAAAFVDDRNSASFVMRAIRDTGREYGEIRFSYEHPFIRYIRSHPEPFLFEEIPETVRMSIRIELDMALIVPSFLHEKCLGFLVMGYKLNHSLYSADDLRVFKTLSNQAALAVENTLFMEESKRNQERLFNAEKLAAIGGMADGVAHQIKNRLYEFSIVSQEMELDLGELKLRLEPDIRRDSVLGEKIDYLSECARTIVSNVKKTNSIIQGILNFARTEQNATAFTRFSLRDVVQQAAELIKVKHQTAQVPLVLDIPDDDTIYGVKGQMQECIYNCLDNAYEAVREKMDFRLTDEARVTFVPEIRVRLRNSGTQATIDIVDNGIGIKEEDKPKIFAAFFTTKASSKSGSGIGSYVVRRMVEENHHGKMRFQSTYMQGSTFTIQLPFK